MDIDDDKDSFRLDTNANSFQLKGFRWHDLPGMLVGLAVAVCLITGFNFVVDIGLSYLGRDVVLLLCGISLGFLVGVWVGSSWSTNSGRTGDSSSLLPLSESVKQIASDPARKIEAIKKYREESGASLAEAKQMVEAYARQSI